MSIRLPNITAKDVEGSRRLVSDPALFTRTNPAVIETAWKVMHLARQGLVQPAQGASA